MGSSLINQLIVQKFAQAPQAGHSSSEKVKSEMLCQSSAQKDLDFRTVWRLVCFLFLNQRYLNYLSLLLLPMSHLGLNSKFLVSLLERQCVNVLVLLPVSSSQSQKSDQHGLFHLFCRPCMHALRDWSESIYFSTGVQRHIISSACILLSYLNLVDAWEFQNSL